MDACLHVAGGELTASGVHATLCGLVTTHAAIFSAWADYATVMLDADTSAFFAARLSTTAEHSDGESNPSSKKRKLRGETADHDPVAVVCEHCGGTVPQVSLRVASLDGVTLDVTVPQRGLVREVRRLAGQVREV